MRLRNCNTGKEYEVAGPVYENPITKIWCGTCKISEKNAFVKLLNYGEIEDPRIGKEMLETAIQEANTLRKIGVCSQRVPRLIDSWQDSRGKRYVIVMEQVPGTSLRHWMETQKKDKLGPKDIFVRVKIVEQLCRIMRSLTEKNPWLVHRDLKPENIYIAFNKETKKWDVYIIDFGCANLNHVRNVGTNNYQAPEQLGSIKDAGTRISGAVDMFAIGQVFYELLMGRAPVIGEDYTYRAKELRWRKTPELPEYLLKINGMASLQETLQRMTAFAADDRPTFGRVITTLTNVRIG